MPSLDDAPFAYVRLEPQGRDGNAVHLGSEWNRVGDLPKTLRSYRSPGHTWSATVSVFTKTAASLATFGDLGNRKVHVGGRRYTETWGGGVWARASTGRART